jgi:hypothetical protein
LLVETPTGVTSREMLPRVFDVATIEHRVLTLLGMTGEPICGMKPPLD